MNFSDFRICASDVGSLLGYLGPYKQWRAFSKVWLASTVRETFFSEPSSFWRENQQHLVWLGVADGWRKLCSTLRDIRYIEDLEELVRVGFSLLCRSDNITKLAENEGVSMATINPVILQETANSMGDSPLAQSLHMSSRILKDLKSKAQKQYGIAGEMQFKEARERFHHSPLLETPEAVMEMGPIAGYHYTWCLLGKIDGLADGEIVEIKCRAGPFFKQVPEYELAQIMAYMFLHKKQSACLLQCGISRQYGLFSSETRVPFDTELWARMLTQLERTLRVICELRSSSLAAQCFFALPLLARIEIINSRM
jgi:hypothetical protein